MTDRTEALTQAAAPAFATEGSYIDWPAILAGAVVATAIASVFTTFGAALGLGLVSPYEGEGSATAALIAVGTWMLWTTISSFMAGGYITGRMRRRVDHASADEVAVRDGIHGLAVWGVGVLVAAFLLGASADTAARVTADTAAAVATMPMETTGATGAEAQSTTQTAETATISEAEAKAIAETARKYSVISAFVLASALMIAGAGSYWASGIGGQHRDEGRVFARFGRWT